MKWDRDKLGDTILLCSAAARKAPPTDTDIAKSLGVLFKVSASDRISFVDDIRRAVEHLIGGGMLVREGKRLTLTEGGKSRCQRVFDLRFPCRSQWRHLKTRLLARALAPQAPISVVLPRVKDGKGGVVALAINAVEGVSPAPAPTLKEIREALAWRELGGDPSQKPTYQAMVNLLLQRALGAPAGMSREMLLRTWAAKSVAASNVQPDAIRVAALRAWITASPAAEPEFLDRVRQAASHPDTKTFGRKAFLASVFDTYTAFAASDAVAWTDFSERLIQAHVDEQVSLSRADLVTAMDADLVERSEVRYESETFHFIEIASLGAT